MFIATSRFNGPGSVGAKCDSLDNISLLRSLLNPNEALGYKYFVPTGLRPFFASYFVITHNSNTLTEHHQNLFWRTADQMAARRGAGNAGEQCKNCDRLRTPAPSVNQS